MKKFLYSLGIVALLASCNGDYKDWAGLKTNPDEGTKAVGLGATSADLAIDFGAEDFDAEKVLDIATVKVSSEDPYTLDLTGAVVNEDGSLSAALPIKAVTEEGVVQVVAGDLLKAVKSVYGQTGEATNVLIDLLGTIKVDGQAFNHKAQVSLNATVPLPEFPYEYIYGIGNGTDWNRVCPLRMANGDGIYNGYIYIDGAFKFRHDENAWGAPEWGIGEGAGTIAEGGKDIAEVTEAGYYAITVNLSTMRYELGTKITTIGIIGGFPGNDWASDVAKLEYNKTTGAWEGTCEIPAGVEFKFRANDDWGINWGGTADALTQDGANLTVDNTDVWKIQLFAFCNGKAHVTFIPSR